MRRVLSSFGRVAGLLLVVALFLAVAPPAFRTVYNAKTIVTQTVITGIGALGMTLVIVSGGIDLSVGSVIALSTVVAARVLRLDPSGTSILWPLVAAGAAAVAGAGQPSWRATSKGRTSGESAAARAACEVIRRM